MSVATIMKKIEELSAYTRFISALEQAPSIDGMDELGPRICIGYYRKSEAGKQVEEGKNVFVFDSHGNRVKAGHFTSQGLRGCVYIMDSEPEDLNAYLRYHETKEIAETCGVRVIR